MNCQVVTLRHEGQVTKIISGFCEKKGVSSLRILTVSYMCITHLDFKFSGPSGILSRNSKTQ